MSLGIHSAVATLSQNNFSNIYILGFNIFFLAKYYVNVSNTFLGVLVSNDFMIFYSAKNKIKKMSSENKCKSIFQRNPTNSDICQSIKFQEKFAKGTGTVLLQHLIYVFLFLFLDHVSIDF